MLVRGLTVCHMGTVDNDTGTPEPARGPGTLRRVGVLEKLADIGMTIALSFREQAAIELARDLQIQADWTPANGSTRVAPSDIPAAYDRIARSVRQTLALADKLEAGRKARSDDTEAEAADPRAVQVDPTIGPRAKVRKDIVRRALERALEAEAPESDAENLLSDLYERLDDLGEDAEVAALGLYEVLIAICRGLGLTPDERRRIELRWGPKEDDPPGAPSWGAAVINAAIADLEAHKVELRAAMAARSRDGPGPGAPAPPRPRTP